METKGHLCIRNLDDNGETRFFTSINLKCVKVNELKAAINTIIEAGKFTPEDIYDITGKFYSKLSRSQKHDFTLESIGELSDDDIEEAYNDRDLDKGTEEISPENMTFEQQCYMLRNLLRILSLRRIDPSEDEAVATLRSVYQYMSWK